jgi:L-aminopeptidase/D-esterase-like protein
MVPGTILDGRIRVTRMELTRRELARLGMSGTAAALAAAAGVGPARAQPTPANSGALTDVPGVRVGHYTDPRRPTGCTAILFDDAVTAGADYDGSAPGEMLGVMLQPVSPLDRIHGILLTGGGPMGLDAVAGVVRHLETRGVGYDWGVPNVRIPIVVGAVIDDLSVGDGRIRPDPEAAVKACEATTTAGVPEGSVGVGAGATVGKMFRSRGLGGMKGGVGTVAIRRGDVVIAALSVVNAAGDILDWRTGRIVAGARTADGTAFANSAEVLQRDLERQSASLLDDQPFRATTLTVVATNVALDKTRLTKLAMMVNTGAARAINPYHTQGDGDQVLAISTNRLKRDVSLTAIGSTAAEAAADAIQRGVEQAAGVPGWPAVREVKK